MGSGRAFQALTATACGFAFIAMGIIFVWPSYTNPVLRAENTTLLDAPLTVREEGLLSSLPSLGGMVGSALVGPLINTFGRKWGASAATLTYAVTILDVNIRFQVFNPHSDRTVRRRYWRRGQLGVHAHIHFRSCRGFYQRCISISPNFMLQNRSPVIIPGGLAPGVRHHRVAERGVGGGVQRAPRQCAGESRVLAQEESGREGPENPDKEKLRPDKNNKMAPPKTSAIKTLFTSPESRSAFFTVLGVISMQIMMGMGAVQVYAKYVFRQADPARADLYSVVFAVVVVAGGVVSGAITDRAGRRVLIISSSILVGVCMATLGFLVQTRVAPPWLTVLMLMLFCFFFMCGAGSIPYVLMTEVFSPEVQGCASMLLVEWVWFVSFVTLSLFPPLRALLGIHGAFYIFAANSAVNAVLAFLFVPETKGLSNAQIQKIFLMRHRS